MNTSIIMQYQLLSLTLRLLGYLDEPITTTTRTWWHPRTGNRVGINLNGKWWFNHGS